MSFPEGSSSAPPPPSNEVTGGSAPDPKILIKAVETMRIGLTIADERGRILYTNPADAEIHGYSREELIGRHVSVYSPRNTEEIRSEPAEFALWERERTNVARDGHVFPVRLLSDVVRDEAGAPVAMITLCEDITDELATETALAETEEAYRTLFESASDLLLTLDLEGRIRLANRAARRALGLDLGGGSQRLEDLVAPEHRQRWSQSAREALESGGAKVELVLGAGEGQSIPVEGRLDLRRDEVRGPQILAIFREVRERHALDRLREEFVSVVNHELRTPITSMLGALALLEDSGVVDRDERSIELLSIALRNGRRLQLLIDGLLDLQKMSAGLLRFECAPTDLRALLERAAEDLAAYGETARVGLELDVEPEEITVQADPDRLLHALYNLITNAIKFSPERDTVSISARRNERGASITVRDRGPGIPQAFQDHLFDPFIQGPAPDSSGRSRSGSGLGLTIAKRFVEGCGGTIEARHCPDGGTAVTIELPG